MTDRRRTGDGHRSPRIKFAWYDLWVGFFYDRRTRTGYLCPLPTIRIRLWGPG